MPSVQKLRDLLQRHGLAANPRLGQNFLVEDSIYDHILRAADLKTDDTVIEVGPGTGFLTERLVEKTKKVIAVEYDAGMVRLLNERFSDTPNLTIIHSDILKFWIQKSGVESRQYKVVANIPYYITSPLIRLFLQSECPPSLMVVLVQKEVAEKVCGLTDKSLITLETQLFGRPEIVAIVPPSAFWPSPKVDSAILKIVPYAKPLVSAAKAEELIRLMKHGFAMKRKMLANSLAAGLHMKSSETREVFVKAGIDSDCRAEDLSLEEWIRLGNILTKK